MRYGHPPEGHKFICSLCHKEYKNGQSLREHMARCGQGDTRPHHCECCDARYEHTATYGKNNHIYPIVLEAEGLCVCL